MTHYIEIIIIVVACRLIKYIHIESLGKHYLNWTNCNTETIRNILIGHKTFFIRKGILHFVYFIHMISKIKQSISFIFYLRQNLYPDEIREIILKFPLLFQFLKFFLSKRGYSRVGFCTHIFFSSLADVFNKFISKCT